MRQPAQCDDSNGRQGGNIKKDEVHERRRAGPGSLGRRGDLWQLPTGKLAAPMQTPSGSQRHRVYRHAARCAGIKSSFANSARRLGWRSSRKTSGCLSGRTLLGHYPTSAPLADRKLRHYNFPARLPAGGQAASDALVAAIRRTAHVIGGPTAGFSATAFECGRALITVACNRGVSRRPLRELWLLFPIGSSFSWRMILRRGPATFRKGDESIANRLRLRLTSHTRG